MSVARAAWAAMILGLAPSATAWAEARLGLSIVHVEANTGASAGGHAALRIGDQVFHYQAHPEGLLLLDRDSWGAFQHRYGELGNRTIHLTDLAASPEAAGAVRARLERSLGLQRQALERARALQLERGQLEALAGGSSRARLPGVGLFGEGGSSEPGRALRRRVVAARGEHFLAARRAALARGLSSTALEVSRLPAADATANLPTLSAERRWDAYSLREALRVLDEATPLQAGVLLDAGALDPRIDGAIAPTERAWLESLAQFLEQRVLALLGSPRPDRGQALLLAVARHRAVLRSLAVGRLLSLDPFPDGATEVPAPRVKRRLQVVATLVERSRLAYQEARAALSVRELGEASWYRLEQHAGRHLELVRGSEGRSIRLLGTALPPSRGAVVAPPAVSAGPAEIRAALASARENERRYLTRLRERYRYDLLRRNCATELAAALESSFPDAAAARQALGGDLDPAGAFIPFVFAASAGRRFEVTGRRTVPSHRRRQVDALVEAGGLRVALRESNVLTSRVYRRAIADDGFLFFSDGSPWLRPLKGLGNLSYGLLQGTLGIVTLPLDRGERLGDGLRGALYSLPELAFVGIRKGHFDLVPEPD